MIEKVKSLLDQLHFRGMSTCVEEVLIRAEQQGCAINDVLIELLEAEYRDQQECPRFLIALSCVHARQAQSRRRDNHIAPANGMDPPLLNGF